METKVTTSSTAGKFHAGSVMPPKLSAEQPQIEAIIRVEITAQTLNEKNEDGTWKYSDDQLREWLTKLRGDREVTVAKKVARETGAAKKAAKGDDAEDEEMTDDE